jgi:hypothetical protein
MPIKWPQNISTNHKIYLSNGHKIHLSNGHKIHLLNGHKIYQMITKYIKWLQNIPNGRNIDQLAIKYTNIFHCKTLQNLPKMGFWF